MRKVEFGKQPVLGWAVGLLPAKFHRLKIPPGASAEIEFRLNPAAVRKGYHFKTDEQEDCIWVSEDTGRCPGPGNSHPQIEVLECCADRIAVRDQNSGDPVTLRYQLNVFDPSGKPAPIDPIIENGGGGSPLQR